MTNMASLDKDSGVDWGPLRGGAGRGLNASSHAHKCLLDCLQGNSTRTAYHHQSVGPEPDGGDTGSPVGMVSGRHFVYSLSHLFSDY